MAYFLAKTEPSTYSIDDLKRDKKTEWDGVRNPAAVNAIKSMKPGDKVIIYHSQGQGDRWTRRGRLRAARRPERRQELGRRLQVRAAREEVGHTQESRSPTSSTTCARPHGPPEHDVRAGCLLGVARKQGVF